MLIQEIELDILNLQNKQKKIVKLKENEICMQGFRIDHNGNIMRGVPHRNQNDCIKFCYRDTCDNL
jgi:hypothetical protein